MFIWKRRCTVPSKKESDKQQISDIVFRNETSKNEKQTKQCFESVYDKQAPAVRDRENKVDFIDYPSEEFSTKNHCLSPPPYVLHDPTKSSEKCMIDG